VSSVSSEKAREYVRIIADEKTDLSNPKIQEVSESSANNCFKINEKYFVKIEHYSGMRSLIYRESVLLDNVDFNVNVPNLINYGNINGAFYRIFEHIEGDSFYLTEDAESFEKLSRDDRRKLIHDMGKSMASVHKHRKFNKPGALNMIDGRIKDASCDNWFEAFMQAQRFWFDRLEENGHNKMLEDLEDFFKDKKSVLNSCKDFSFIHQQLDLRNIIFTDENKLYLIDWEEVISGDPLMDVVITETILFWFNDLDENLRQEFREGYRSVRDLEFYQDLVETYKVAELSRLFFIFDDHEKSEPIRNKLSQFLS
jgi:aminoglycoside phosphotransferase (APT) family kinase protein